MKLTNTKIKNLIRESLKRILFESEDELDRLKAEFDRKVEELGQSRTDEEFNRRNAEIQELEKRINSLTRTMFKEPEEPGEFDFMQSDPIEYPVPYQSGEMTAHEEDPPERAAMFDVTPGSPDLEFQDMAGQPMTAKEKQQAINRRGFLQGLGASAMLGKQILDSDSLFSTADSSFKTTPLTNEMIEAATEGYVDEHFDYNAATDVISNGTLDDIELFENNQAVRCAVDYMDIEGIELNKSDRDKLLNAIRAKVDKIMSRLGGP